MTPVQLKAIENDDVNEKNDDIDVSNTVEKKYGYPALESISGFIKFIAWVGLIGSIIIALMSQANRVDGTTLLIYLLSGLISFVVLLAASEIIRLFISMAKDLRLLKDSIIKDD